MADHARAPRLAERIKVLAAGALTKVVKDPDLGFVTFTGAKVTPDLMQAKLYFTVFGTDVEKAKSVEILLKNTGRLKGEIGKQLGIRLTPNLELILDEVPEIASDLNDLLAEAKRRDSELGKLAKEAKHAGDADPYVQKPQAE